MAIRLNVSSNFLVCKFVECSPWKRVKQIGKQKVCWNDHINSTSSDYVLHGTALEETIVVVVSSAPGHSDRSVSVWIF